MKAGDLDQRVTVERFTSTEDELGQPIQTCDPRISAVPIVGCSDRSRLVAAA